MVAASTLRTIMIVCLIAVHTIFCNTANAQSKHASLWRIGSYCLDFNGNTPTFHPHDLDYKIGGITSNCVWYVDSDGSLSVVAGYENGKIAIYDKDTEKFNELTSEYQLGDGFFVPMPGDESKVFYIEQNRYFLIDLKLKTISLKGDDINILRMHHIAVHHSDCDKVWIINTDKKIWTTYLLTPLGIEKVREVALDESDYNSFPSRYNWEVSLSADCEHYTMVNFDDYKTEVYYGDFDRQTGEFTRKSRYDFGEDYRHINNSIIAPDNSRIYYYYNTSTRNAYVVEVPIVDDVPNYEKKKIIYSGTANLAGMYRMMFYGLDNKVYILDGSWRKIHTIEINAQGESVFTDTKFEIPKDNDFGRYIDFVSSWFLEKPCDESSTENPCPTIPDTPTLDLSPVCASQTKSYSVETPEPNVVYHWTITGGTADKSTGDRISVKWQDNEVDGKITVYGEDPTTNCVSETITYNVKINKSPLVEFDNAFVCHGQPLSIISSGYAPFEISYTIDGEPHNISTSDTEYKLPDVAGRYKITKIKDASCEFSPTENNEAEIAPQMKKLGIVEE